jgi:hypothetical protein
MEKYTTLIDDFMNGTISAPDFEKSYWSAMKDETQTFGPRCFQFSKDFLKTPTRMFPTRSCERNRKISMTASFSPVRFAREAN